MATNDKPIRKVPRPSWEQFPVPTEATEVVPAQDAPTVAAPDPDYEDAYIINDDSGELRLVRTRAGYAPAPMPFGFRLAKNDEIPGK